MICENCQSNVNSIVIHDKQLWCRPCHEESKGIFNKAPYVIGDECDVEIKHGICNSDGSPKRYRFKSDIKQAAWETGYFQGDDTPKTNPRLAEERQAKREGYGSS